MTPYERKILDIILASDSKNLPVPYFKIGVENGIVRIYISLGNIAARNLWVKRIKSRLGVEEWHVTSPHRIHGAVECCDCDCVLFRIPEESNPGGGELFWYDKKYCMRCSVNHCGGNVIRINPDRNKPPHLWCQSCHATGALPVGMMYPKDEEVGK